MDAYIYRAALYCERDADKIMATLTMPAEDVDYDSDRYPIGPSPYGGGESDTPQHCDACGVFLENDLTDDGRAYVRDAVGESDVLTIWRTFYADSLA